VLGVRRWRSYRCGVVAGREVLDFGELAGLQKPARRGLRWRPGLQTRPPPRGPQQGEPRC
jgi:hypothetical protein